MSTCLCAHCRGAFERRPQNPDQTYCSKPECQRARKRHWQRVKRRTDSDYRENQREAQRRWQAKNPDYWKRWRAAHPEAVERNRARQQVRNGKRLGREGGAGPAGVGGDASRIAKMDASTEGMALPSGTYRLVPADCKDGRVNFGFLCEISRLPGSQEDFR